MRTLEVIQLACGWSVRSGAAATMPCRSRAAAVAQAERMADALRRHGEPVAVVIAEDGDIPPALNRGGAERVRSRKIMPPIRTGK